MNLRTFLPILTEHHNILRYRPPTDQDSTLILTPRKGPKITLRVTPLASSLHITVVPTLQNPLPHSTHILRTQQEVSTLLDALTTPATSSKSFRRPQ